MSNAALPAQDEAQSGSEKPLANPVFRALWIATVVSNIGTWMHDVGASWLMTSLSPSPLMVALVQAATTFPIFILSLPAGALADIVDRRKLLIAAQAFALVAMAVLAVMTYLGITTGWMLLAFTAAISVGGALSAPAFQAIVPELVPHKSLQQAVAINSLGINIARAIGPAVGGAIIALAGPWAVFALNAVSVLGILFVLFRWQREVTPRRLPAEHFFSGMRAGIRYARRAPDLKIILARSVGFFLFASSLWALLPLIARRDLGLGPAGYGGLLTFMGGGAIAGALLLPKIRARLSTNRMTLIASLMLAGVIVALAFVKSFAPAAAVLTFGGFAWIGMMAALNGGAQATSPAWVKARALAIYLLVFQGAMTAGSTIWGATASRIGIAPTLEIAAALLVIATLFCAWRFPINEAGSVNLTPSMHWPSPEMDSEVGHDRGPVMVTIEYEIDPDALDDFTEAMGAMRRIRERDGAIQWGMYQDASDPALVVEFFTVESWLEHLRQHDRVTKTDKLDQEVVHTFHRGSNPPRVRHLIAPDRE